MPADEVQQGPAGGEPASLRLRFLHGAAWSLGSRLVLVLLGLLVTAILARLLDPADYGLLGMATVFIGLAQQARDMGIGQALLQRPTLTEAARASGFTLSLAFGLTLFAFFWVAAPAIAAAYGETQVAPVIRFLAIVFPISAFQTVPQALLRRELRLRGEAVSRTAATVADALGTVVLAYMGMGVWALAAGPVIHNVVFALALFRHQPWRPSLRMRSGEEGSLLRFGGGVTLSSFLWYLFSNADFFIVGRLLGRATLGTYSMAWNLARMPWENFWTGLSPMALPLFSRYRERMGQNGTLLIRLSHGLALITWPALAGVLAVSDRLVPAVLGPKWSAVATPLRWLCVYGLCQSMAVLLSPALRSTGRIRREVWFNAACAILLPAAFLIAAPSSGVGGVAAVWATLYPLLVATALLPAAVSATGADLRAYARALAPPGVAAVAMVVAVLAVGRASAGPASWVLPAQIATGVFCYAALLRLMEGTALKSEGHALWQDLRRVVRQ